MRRAIAAAATAVLALTAIAAGEGADETELPDPVEVSMYFHGEASAPYTDDTDPIGAAMVMDRTEPTGDFESMQLLNYGVGPNPNCTGNGLFPTWTGWLGDGAVVGEATMTMDVVGSTGGTATVQVWADVSGQNCNDAFIEPFTSVDVDLPMGAGTVEFTIPLDGFSPDFSMLMMVRPADGGPASFSPEGQARLMYDGEATMSNITFTCQPSALEEGDAAEDANCLPF